MVSQGVGYRRSPRIEDRHPNGQKKLNGGAVVHADFIAPASPGADGEAGRAWLKLHGNEGDEFLPWTCAAGDVLFEVSPRQRLLNVYTHTFFSSATKSPP